MIDGKTRGAPKNAGIETCTLVQFPTKIRPRVPKNNGKLRSPEHDVDKVNLMGDYSGAFMPAYSI